MSARYPSWDREYQRAYRERSDTPEKRAARKAKQKAWREANREQIYARRKAALESNPERHEAQKAKQREWYESNKPRHLAKTSIYRVKNSAKIKATKRDHYQRNSVRISESCMRRYWANRKERIRKVAEWQAANRPYMRAYRRHKYKTDPEYRRRHNLLVRKWQAIDKASGKTNLRQRIRRKKRMDGLTDQYVREVLAKNSIVKARDFPQELVELKRAEIRLKQQLKQKHENATISNQHRSASTGAA